MLHPEIPPEGRVREPRPGEPEGELSPRIAGLAEEEGIVMRRAKLTPYTIHAQAVTEYAKKFGKANEFHHAAYKAFWEDGVNLGDFDVLSEIATGVGLDWQDVLPKLEAREYDRLIQDQLAQALKLGGPGVPGLRLHARTWVTGPQPTVTFRAAPHTAPHLGAADGTNASEPMRRPTTSTRLSQEAEMPSAPASVGPISSAPCKASHPSFARRRFSSTSKACRYRRPPIPSECRSGRSKAECFVPDAY